MMPSSPSRSDLGPWVAWLLLTWSASAMGVPALAMDATGNPHPINPDVYGIFGTVDATLAQEIQLPNVRWGGDATSRYNWQVDSSNAGFDWYFMGGNGQNNPPGASVDQMVSTFRTASNAHALITIPILPYVNKSSAWNCSFPVSLYGHQESTNPYVHPSGDDCGNSLADGGLPDGGEKQLLDMNIHANHIDNSVALQQGWVQHLVSTFGTAADGGVPFYQLDNEPLGWANTHRDVQPAPASYDTIIALGQQYAAMVKSVDSSAKVFGPVDFTLGGWIGNTSQQNGLYAGQYYLQKMAAYESQHGARILDYFDEHYYGGGSTVQAELDSTRTLWDPTFNGGTWVEQYVFGGPMKLIPRFKSWIDQYYPGTKLSISEYSFAYGTQNGPITDALAEADALGIFGREGVDFANLFSVPKPTDPLAYSFRLYRNYDGNGGRFGETSVTSTSSNEGSLSIFGALRSKDGALTAVVINKTNAAIQTSVSLAHFDSAASAAVYTYSSSNLTQIARGNDEPVASHSINHNFPAYSATVLVFAPLTVVDAGTAIDAGAGVDSGVPGADSGQPGPGVDGSAGTPMVTGGCGCEAVPLSSSLTLIFLVGFWTRRRPSNTRLQ